MGACTWRGEGGVGGHGSVWGGGGKCGEGARRAARYPLPQQQRRQQRDGKQALQGTALSTTALAHRWG